jgi:N-acetylneuraminic acid mutarotase
VGTFYRLNLAEPKAWEPLPSGPGLQGLAVVAHQGKVYRIAGMQPRNQPGEPTDNHSVATCARFDPAAGKWEPLPDLPEARSSHDAVVVGDKIVVVGGWKLNGAGKTSEWHSDALLLDLGKAPLEWQSIKQPFRRRALAAAAHDGKVYVLGGMTDESKTVLTTSILDPNTGAWTTGPDLPSPRRNGFSPGACELKGQLYVSGSDGRVLRLEGKTWQESGILKQSRIVHRMLPVPGNALVVVGGAAGGDNIGLTEVVVPARGKQ